MTRSNPVLDATLDQALAEKFALNRSKAFGLLSQLCGPSITIRRDALDGYEFLLSYTQPDSARLTVEILQLIFPEYESRNAQSLAYLDAEGTVYIHHDILFDRMLGKLETVFTRSGITRAAQLAALSRCKPEAEQGRDGACYLEDDASITHRQSDMDAHAACVSPTSLLQIQRIADEVER